MILELLYQRESQVVVVIQPDDAYMYMSSYGHTHIYYEFSSHLVKQPKM